MSMTRWSISFDRLRVQNADEDSFFSNGDEPYFVAIGFRSRFLTPGSTKVFWSGDLDAGWAGPGGHIRAGGSATIPPRMGVVQFPGVQLLTAQQVQAGAMPEVVGVVLMSFEDDGTPWSTIDGMVHAVVAALKGELTSLVENGRIDLSDPQRDIAAANERVRAATKTSILQKISILVQSAGDPDDFFGSTMLLYLAMSEANPVMVPLLRKQPLEVQFAASGVRYDVSGGVSQVYDAGWDSLGGGLRSGPAISSWSPGRLDVFARGEDDALWHRYTNDGDAWSRWETLRGGLTSDPAAVSWGPGRIDAMVRGTDNAVWHKYFNGKWSGWETLGGVASSGPAVCSWAPGRLDLFVRGADNTLWHKWFDGAWSEWEGLGGSLTSDPAAVSWGPGRIDVVAKGLNGVLLHKYYDHAWSGWETLPGQRIGGAPAISSWAPGRVDIVARGAAQLVPVLNGEDLTKVCLHRWYENGWSDWEILGGEFNSDFDVVSWGPDRLDVVGRGLDNAMWHTYWNNRWPIGPERLPHQPPVVTVR